MVVNQKHYSTLGSISRKDVRNPNAIPACKYFNKRDHDFNNNRKFIIIEQPRNIRTTSIETARNLKL